MHRLLKFIFPLIGFIAFLAIPAAAPAANSGLEDEIALSDGGEFTLLAARTANSAVDDEGHFFSADAVAQAERVIAQIHAAHDKEVLVVTYPSIPDAMKPDFAAQGKDQFFENWAEEIRGKRSVTGVVILACKDPSHLQISVGNKTKEKAFTNDDRRELSRVMLASFKAKQFDGGLTDAVKFIQTRMDRNLGTRSASAAAPTPHTAQPATPYATPPASPSYTPPVSQNRSYSTGGSVGSLICVGIGILVVVFIIIAIVGRSRSGGQGYGGYNAPPPPGGYPPGYSGGYPQQGGYGGGGMGVGGGGGGGFGRGLLGGLLGGALGAWGYDKFSRPSGDNYVNPNPGGANPGGGYPNSGPAPDNSDQTDTSSSGSGGDFGSSPDNNSGGGGDFNSSGGDFGSSSDNSSGGDFGSSSSDSGGGGDFSSSGGDFGGGGGDSGGGGGGDSGGGGGGDF